MGVSTAAVQILSGASLSGVIDLAGGVFGGFIIKAAWTAAAVTFQVSVNGIDYFNLFKSAGVGAPTEVVIGAVATPVQADTFHAVIPADFPDALAHGYRYMKVRSGTSGAVVAQGATRDIVVAIRFH